MSHATTFVSFASNLPSSNMETTHAETSAAGARRTGLRLTPVARQLLKDFAEEVSKYPNSCQKQELLEKVRRLPGCGFVEPESITRWFQRYRTIAKKKTEDDSLLFPNIAAKQLEVLRTLLRNNPTPTKEMIDIWATCITAEIGDVRMWVSYHQAKIVPQELSEPSISVSPTSPHPHLPTPARSLSPPRVREMSLPLIATKEESSPPGTPLMEGWPTHAANVSHTSSTQHVTEEFDELHSQSTQILSSAGGSRPLCDVPAATPSAVMQLAKDIKQMMASPSHNPASRLPTTHAEFNAMFKPYEEMMMRFIHNVESGKLQHLGPTWGPSPCTAQATST